jgi:hypothetical protein
VASGLVLMELPVVMPLGACVESFAAAFVLVPSIELPLLLPSLQLSSATVITQEKK